MMESLLIANRGEIARRIIRTARRLGVRTIAVYSDADAGHAARARGRRGRPHRPGAGARKLSRWRKDYWRAAKATGAEAIHPGYGFLSENAEFAEAVSEGRADLGRPAAGARSAPWA